MRKALTFALTVAIMACFSMPLSLAAQVQKQIATGTLTGRSVDIAGRGVSGERVELLRGAQIVNSVTTNGLGGWSFQGIEPGGYIVKMNVRGRIAGVRVTVAAGQVISGTMIVVPAATASTQLGALSGLLSLAPATAAAAAQTVSATVDSAKTTELSPTLLVEILTKLPEPERKAFAAEVVAAIKNEAVGAATFAQYQAEFQTIATTGVVPPVTAFPPPEKVSGN